MSRVISESPIYHIACVGESICYGSFAEPVTTMSYQAQLQRLLGPGFKVHDYSASGSPFLPEMKWPWAHQGYIGSVQGYHSIHDENDIILILLGNNDSKERVWNAPTGGEQNFRAKVKELIEAYKALPTNPYICILLAPPAFPEGTPGKKLYEIRDSVVKNTINPLLIEIAEECGCDVIDLRSLFPEPNTPEGAAELETLYGEGDGVHPNNEGYTRIATRIYEKITEKKSLLFEPNGEEVTEMPKDQLNKYSFGQSVPLPKETPIRPGYIFRGWATEKKGISLKDDSLSLKGSDITLYAQWEAAPFYSQREMYI